MLTLWRRHNPKHCKLQGRDERKCHCPIWISGVDDAGNQIKETTKLRDWTKAEALARHWDNTGAKPVETPRVTIEDWRDAFLTDAASSAGRNLKPPTVEKYKQLFKPLTAFTQKNGYRYVNQLDLDALTTFRATWKDAPLSASKKLKRLRGVLKFAMRRKWIAENPALDMDMPKIRQKPTMPFTAEEIENILKAAKDDERTRVLIQVMLHSGLRIMDVAMLKVDSLMDNRIRLHQEKTGEHVSVLIPKKVADDLRALPKKHPGYFFWTGRSTAVSAVGWWQQRLAAVFKKAKVRNGHSHRFRDSFAVGLLTAGTSLENVSRLLGHTSIKTTEQFYSPWIKTRQDALDAAVMSAALDFT
jgi:site-specific recombinase XerD